MTKEERIIEMLERIQSDLSKIRDDLSQTKGEIPDIWGNITKIKSLASHAEKLNALMEWTRNVQEGTRVPSAKYFRENKKDLL